MDLVSLPLFLPFALARNENPSTASTHIASLSVVPLKMSKVGSFITPSFKFQNSMFLWNLVSRVDSVNIQILDELHSQN